MAVSMKEVAARAGVHPSTVSRCLRNSPAVSAATRDRVKKIARELGYRPNPLVQSLMSSRRTGKLTRRPPLLGFLTFFPTRDGWKKRSLPDLELVLEAGMAQARLRGYELQEFWSPLAKSSPERFSRIVRNRGFMGLIFTQVPSPMETMGWGFQHFACVTIGTSLGQPGIHRVRSNLFAMVVRAMRECHQRGYRRIGLALDEEFDRRTQSRWLGGWLLMQRQLNLVDPPEPLLVETWNAAVFADWLRQNRPDVILTLKVAEVERWLEAAGHKVPRDIGVVGISAAMNGRYSGVCEDWAMHGIRAVNLLVDLLAVNDIGLSPSPITSLVEGRWNPGQTIRALPSG